MYIRIRKTLLMLGVCLCSSFLYGCHGTVLEAEPLVETTQSAVDEVTESDEQDATKSAPTQPTPTEPEETYSPSDIRTRVPEVGETYYTEQVTEVSKDEALALTQEILSEPGKVFVLGEGYANPLEILLDVDVDGVPERIALSCQGEMAKNYRYSEIDGVLYVTWEMYTLSVNEASYEIGYMGKYQSGWNDQKYRWNVLAFSPDGERILLALTEVISEEDTQGNYTHIFAYGCETLNMVFDTAIDLLGEHTVIGKDNLIAVKIPFDPFGGRILFEWKMDEDGVYQRYYEEMYDFLDEVFVMVSKPIALYEEPDLGAKKVATIDQQKVMVKKSEMIIERDKDGASAFVFGPAKNWVYLETMDGVGGWIQVSDSVQLADGEWENILLVFESVSSGQ